jgi:hypothetical protein
MDNNAVNKAPATQRESFSELLGQLAKNSAAMVHDEIELGIQDVREKVRNVRSEVLTVAAGMVISFVALMSFCAALIIGLAYYMPPVVAAFVTGTALVLTGVIVIFIGSRQLKKTIRKT